jgi:hypothetical protein
VKTYSTGEVAKICKFKNARIVAKLFDDGEIKGDLVHSKYHRQTTRRVSLRELCEFMKAREIPFNGFDGDVCAQKWILDHLTLELREMLHYSKKRSGVFNRGNNGLANGLLHLIDNLDPLDKLTGTSEDRQRLVILKKLIEVMARHIELRGTIASAKKRK